MTLVRHLFRATHKRQFSNIRTAPYARTFRTQNPRVCRCFHSRSYGTKILGNSSHKAQATWKVAVRDRFMVARTFHEDKLASSGNKTAAGSTLVVDAVFSGTKLQTGANYLLDICAAQEILKNVLAEYNYRSLDLVFPNLTDPGRRNLEGLAKTIWERVVSQIGRFEFITSLRIGLQDPDATITFESPISRLSSAVTAVSVRDRFQLAGPFKLTYGLDVEATLSGTEVLDGDVLDYRLLKDTLSDVKGNMLPSILNTTEPLARSIWTEVANMLLKRGIDKGYGLKLKVVEADGSNTFYSQPLSSISLPGDVGGWGVEVSEGCRVTHSFEGECFGTAQGSHGTTFEVSVAFELNNNIGAFDRTGVARVVSKVLSEYNQQDLDKLEEFTGCNTTCEHMANVVWEKVRRALPTSQQDLISNCRVRIRESDVAFVDYEGIFGNEQSKKPRETNKTNSGVETNRMYNVLSFVGPSKVDVESRRQPSDRSLLPNEVEIESLYSLVSTGTEMRAFKGTFKEGEPMDTNFYDGKVWKYPMEYGYSLVGKVASAGSEVPHDLLGKTIFAFLPHASRAVEDYRNVHVVPDGISPQDASFLPAVETALSIVHEAHPRAMETVCVFGQGLIGRLVTWLLNKTNPLGRVVAVDPCESRRLEGIRMGAHEALLAGPDAEKFDVCVEVSGNGTALQACLNSTKFAGKVVVASWYSEDEPVPLQLGTDFHRSHINIVSTQVSQIPGEILDRWSKARRFNACWDLIKQLKPSQRIPVHVAPLERAQEAFELLENREISCIQFSYQQNDELIGKHASVGVPNIEEPSTREDTKNLGLVEFISKAMLPTTFGTFDTRVFNIKNKDELCVTLLVGEIGKNTKEIWMRLHDSCFTSEVLGSCKCDCKHQLEKAQKLIQKLIKSENKSQILVESNNAINITNENQEGTSKVGLIIYTFQEGRGIGLGAKMAAYDLQERLGYDTVTANEKLGLPVENREYSFVPSVLTSLGLDLNRVSTTSKSDNRVNLRLLTSNPYKVNALKDLGIITTLNPHIADIDNKSMAAAYVNVKAEKMGHVVSKDAFLKHQPLKTELIIDEVTSKLKSELVRFFKSSGENDLNSGLPFVTLSYAQSLDGTIGNAHALHTSKHISKINGVNPRMTHNGYNGTSERLVLSGDSSMKMTHVLRAKHDAILVGVGTVLTDDPQLTVRCGVSAKWNPTPVILDSSLRTPLDSKLVTQARDCPLERKSGSDTNLIILTSKTSMNPSEPDFSPEKLKAFQELSSIPGVRVVPIESDTSKSDVGVSLVEAFQYLRQGCGFDTVMVEGGATLIASMLKEPLVNHVVLTIVPSFVPGGVKVVSLPNEKLQDRFDLVSRDTFKLGDDWVVTGNFKRSH